MAQHRGALRAARPVLAGTVFAGCESRAVRLRPRQHVVPVWRIAATVEHIALLAQRGLFGEVVRAMQLGDVLGDDHAFGILPGAFADAVPGIHRWLTVSSLGRKVSAPGFRTGTRGLREGLTMIVGAGETAEVSAIADTVGGDKERRVGRLRLSCLSSQCGK